MKGNEVDSYTHPFDDERALYSVPEPEEEPEHPTVMFGQRLLERFGIQVVAHSKPEAEENDDSEFDIRITYVPDDVLTANMEPDLLEVRLATLGKNAWQRTRHKRLLKNLVLLLLVLLVGLALFGHTFLNFFPFSGTPSQTQQTTSFARNDTLPVHRTEPNLLSVGPAHAVIVTAQPIPQYCPTGTMLGQGKQIGNFPVWFSGIDIATAVVHLPPQVLKTAKGWKGWIVHLKLAGRYKYLTTISLTALNIYGSAPPLLQNPSTATQSQRIFIDAQHPMNFLGADSKPNIGTWDILLYLPSAGCYAISASWGPGHWLINFAAGR